MDFFTRLETSLFISSTQPGLFGSYGSFFHLPSSPCATLSAKPLNKKMTPNEPHKILSQPLLLKDESQPASSQLTEMEIIAKMYDLPAVDTESDIAFDDLIALASLLTETPLGAISFVDNEREWIKSTHGFDKSQLELSPSFAAHTIREQEPCFVVRDAAQDKRFANNPLVTGAPHIRFYAGVPMLSAEGVPLGSFCVMDRKPRELTPNQMELLQHIARIAMDLAER